jgi:predicted ArsR family transcriptional regulator
MLTPTARAELLTRTLAVIREHPGSTTARLAKVLGLRIDPMKRYLKKLADDGAVRIEMQQVGGWPRRAYFAAELVVNGHGDGGSSVPAGVSA